MPSLLDIAIVIVELIMWILLASLFLCGVLGVTITFVERWELSQRRYERRFTEHPTTNVIPHPRARPYDWQADQDGVA